MKIPLETQLLTRSQAKAAGYVSKIGKDRGAELWGIAGSAGAGELPESPTDLDQLPGWSHVGCALRARIRDLYEVETATE